MGSRHIFNVWKQVSCFFRWKCGTNVLPQSSRSIWLTKKHMAFHSNLGHRRWVNLSFGWTALLTACLLCLMESLHPKRNGLFLLWPSRWITSLFVTCLLRKLNSETVNKLGGSHTRCWPILALPPMVYQVALQWGVTFFLTIMRHH